MRNNFLEAIAPERTLSPPEIVARIKAHFDAARSNRKTLSRAACHEPDAPLRESAGL